MARRDEVLEAAIEMLDEVGIDAFTTRKLAARLEVRASALYRHYPSKQALLDAMVERIIGGSGEQFPTDLPWDDTLRAAAIGAREAMLAHRDGARLIATFHNPGDKAVESFRTMIARVIAAGVDSELAAAAVDTVFGYVNGFTIEEQARKTDGPGAVRFPPERRDEAFRTGLELILDGIRTRLPASDAAGRPTPDRR